MELLTAARRYLLEWPDTASLVQQRVYKERLGVVLDGTGLSAIVLTQGAGWASPDRVQSIEFPRLVVDCIADPQRDPTGAITVLDAEDKARALTRAVMPAFTFPRLRGERIGGFGSRPGLLIVSSQMWAGPRPLRAGDYHTNAERQAAGDTVLVRTEYALEVAHDG